MCISNSYYAFDDLSGFSSTGGESTGRVVREEQNIESKSSSATLSCMKDLNEAITIDVVERFEIIYPRNNLLPGY